jgi:hypothetical protein
VGEEQRARSTIVLVLMSLAVVVFATYVLWMYVLD